jgi:hypothetical protein
METKPAACFCLDPIIMFGRSCENVDNELDIALSVLVHPQISSRIINLTNEMWVMCHKSQNFYYRIHTRKKFPVV